MKKLLLPTILCLFIAANVLGQTYCESASIDFSTIVGESTSVPVGPPTGSSYVLVVTDCTVTCGGSSVDGMANFTAFIPNKKFPSINWGSSTTVPMNINGNATNYIYNYSSHVWEPQVGQTDPVTAFLTIQKIPTTSSVTLSLPANICSNAGLLTLTGGSPTGGSYSGTGVSGGNLNPAQGDVGSRSITYSYGGSCTAVSVSSNINILAPPTVNITSAPARVCVNGSAVNLGGSPIGGTFSGPGVSGNTFTPSGAGSGVKTVTYSYTDGNSCSNSAAYNINVISLPTISFPNLTGVCIDKAAFQLTAASGSPATGTGVYSGAGTGGTNGTTFTPSGAGGAGTKTLTYTYTDGDGCINSASNTIEVFALPTPTLTVQLASICVNASPVTLGGGSPAGGTYTGNGVTSSIFSPATTGTGLKTITYNYTDGKGCSNSVSNTINVMDITTLSMDTAHICLNATPILLSDAMKASPPGGTYSGSAVTPATGSFNPPVAGEGLKPITYTFQNASQCINTITKNMRVISLPLVQFAAIPSICKDSKPVVLSGGTPTGGLYSAVKGVSNGMFDPATSGITPGPQTITYAITDPKTGCINSINQTLTILDATKPAWPEFLGTPKTVMCKGDNQTLSLNNAGIYTIQWLSGSTSVGTSASYTISGITQDVLLTIKYKDANNCVSDDKNITIELDKIKADFSTATTSVKVGSAVTFTDLSTNASKWSWTMGLEGPSVSQSPVFYFNIVGTKTIKLITTSSNNCKDSITKTNYITVSNTGVNGVKNAGSDQLVVYPNPIHDIVNIDLTGKNEDVTISIVNMAGVKVIEKQFKDANGIVNIHTSEIPAGTYFMVLDIEGKRYTSKLEKL